MGTRRPRRVSTAARTPRLQILYTASPTEGALATSAQDRAQEKAFISRVFSVRPALNRPQAVLLRAKLPPNHPSPLAISAPLREHPIPLICLPPRRQARQVRFWNLESLPLAPCSQTKNAAGLLRRRCPSNPIGKLSCHPAWRRGRDHRARRPASPGQRACRPGHRPDRRRAGHGRCRDLHAGSPATARRACRPPRNSPQ